MFLKVAKILSVKVAPYINSAVAASLSARRVRLENMKKEEFIPPGEGGVIMPPRPKPKLTTCRNRKTSFSLIAEVTEPEDSTSESPNQNEENSKSNEVFKFRGETSACGEQPRIQVGLKILK